MKNHDDMVLLKENDHSPTTKPKVTGDCDLINREFKIAVMTEFNKIQENRQFRN